MYSITEDFSPILYCRPDVVTLGNPFDTMKRFCLYSQCSHLNLYTLFHLRWMLRRFRCVQIFLKNKLGTNTVGKIKINKKKQTEGSGRGSSLQSTSSPGRDSGGEKPRNKNSVHRCIAPCSEEHHSRYHIFCFHASTAHAQAVKTYKKQRGYDTVQEPVPYVN